MNRYVRDNPCKQTTASSHKRRLNELDNLSSMGHHGGQVRGEILPVRDENDIQMDCADRESRPTNNMNDNNLDEDAFDKNCKIVHQCDKVSKASSSTGVLLEATTMGPAMRGLLHPSAKYEINFDEARQECANILTAWTNGDAEGTRAFIPDIEYCDECMAALGIYSCVEEEAQQIPIEYVDHFGKCGT